MRLLTLLCPLLLSSTFAAAQPPIQGVTGTVATDGTIRSEHEAAGKVAEGAAKVVDGVKKALPGGKGTNPLDGFIEGRRVVVREPAGGDREALTTTEGVVIDVNRKRRQITLRIGDGKAQTLRLIDRSAAKDATPSVVVSYTDATGATVAYDFKRIS